VKGKKTSFRALARNLLKVQTIAGQARNDKYCRDSSLRSEWQKLKNSNQKSKI